MAVGEPLQKKIDGTLPSRRLQCRYQHRRSRRTKRFSRPHPSDTALQRGCGEPQRRGERGDTGETEVLIKTICLKNFYLCKHNTTK